MTTNEKQQNHTNKREQGQNINKGIKLERLKNKSQSSLENKRRCESFLTVRLQSRNISTPYSRITDWPGFETRVQIQEQIRLVILITAFLLNLFFFHLFDPLIRLKAI